MALKDSYDPYQDPLTVTEVGSLMCPAPSYKMKDFPSQSHGKWLIFRNFEDLNKTWCGIRDAVLSGDLGATGTLCGTLKYSPLRHGAGPKTTQRIAVFTKEEDYLTVGLKLVKLRVVQHDIKYKTQEASCKGHFVHNPGVRGRVTCMDIYWNNGDPYASTKRRAGTMLCPPPCRSKDDTENDIWKINVVEGNDQQPCHGKWVIVSNYQKESLPNIEILWDELKAEIETGELPAIRMECPAPHYHNKGMPEIHIFTSQTKMDSVGLKIISRAKQDIHYFSEGEVKTILCWNDVQLIKKKEDKNVPEELPLGLSLKEDQDYLKYELKKKETIIKRLQEELEHVVKLKDEVEELLKNTEKKLAVVYAAKNEEIEQLKNGVEKLKSKFEKERKENDERKKEYEMKVNKLQKSLDDEKREHKTEKAVLERKIAENQLKISKMEIAEQKLYCKLAETRLELAEMKQTRAEEKAQKSEENIQKSKEKQKKEERRQVEMETEMALMLERPPRISSSSSYVTASDPDEF